MRPQAEPRFSKRVPCRLRVAGSTYSGLVLNVSRTGLFVQTNAQTRPGAELCVDLGPGATGGRIPLGAKVVWRRVVAPYLRTVTHGGLGVRIENAPEAFYHFLSRVARETEAPAPVPTPAVGVGTPSAASAASGSPYRVRIRHESGSRSRTLILRSSSEQEARRSALASAGPGWTVLEVQRAR